MDIVYNHVVNMGVYSCREYGWNLYILVVPADPLPHGFPSRGNCCQTAASLDNEKSNQGKNLYLRFNKTNNGLFLSFLQRFFSKEMKNKPLRIS